MAPHRTVSKGQDLPAATLAELNDLLWALPSSLEPERIVGVVLEKGARLFDAPLSAVWLNERGGYLLAGCYGFTDKKAEQLWGSLSLPEHPHQPLALSGHELNHMSAFGKRRLGALFAMPLLTQRGSQGWMVLARLEPVPFSEFEQNLVAIIASRVAAALENARLYQETEVRSEELELLYEIAQLLVSTVKLDELLDLLTRRMTETFRLSGCGIRLYEPGTRTVPMRALYYREPEEQERLMRYFASHPQALEEGRTGQIFRQQAPYVARNIQDDPVFDPGLKEALGVGSLLAAPLFVRGRMVGVLNWFRSGRHNPLNEGMIPLVTHLANQVAIALDNAQLYQEMEQKVAERTADVVADKEKLARQLDEGRRLSQQIRSQLHNILGYAGLLQHAMSEAEEDNPRQLDYLDKLMNAAEGVNTLVADLLEQVGEGR